MKKAIFSFSIIAAFILAITLPAGTNAQVRSRLYIASPYPYENVKKGTHVPITWTSNINGNVSLYYRDRTTGKKNLIKENIDVKSGTATWSIPSSLSNGEYDIVIENNSGSLSHTSQVKIIDGIKWSTFSSPASEKITLTSPNGGETYSYGQPVRITWNHNTLGNNRLNIYVGALGTQGIVWTQIANEVPGNWDGYTWYPQKADIENYLRQQYIRGTPQFKILITDKLNQNAKDTSDGFFYVK